MSGVLPFCDRSGIICSVSYYRMFSAIINISICSFRTPSTLLMASDSNICFAVLDVILQ